MKVQNGNSVSVHYRGTLSDGTEFDNSKVRGQALNFQVGAGQMIPGFDKALVGMTVGET
jgi:FKBP-type peptidyl-prolyl cis-trans isomerase